MTFPLAYSKLGEVQSFAWPSNDFTIFHAGFDPGDFALPLVSQIGIDIPPRIAAAVPKRQAEYFFGRLCSQAALARAGIYGLQVRTGSFREPVWPAGFTGSITHNGSVAAAVVASEARYAGVGIDVETVSHGSLSEAVRATIMLPREFDCLASCAAGMEMDTLSTVVFSAKESFYKGIFGLVRRVLDFNVIEAVGMDESAGALYFEVKQALGAEFLPGYRFHVKFGADATRVITLFHRPTNCKEPSSR